MQTIWMNFLPNIPEGVFVDVNKGEAYHTYPGAGGQHITEFAEAG